jgi:hypothetical protein
MATAKSKLFSRLSVLVSAPFRRNYLVTRYTGRQQHGDIKHPRKSEEAHKPLEADDRSR